MSLQKHERTSEHVSQGHPDKFCDKVADWILDEALDAGAALSVDERDPNHPRHQRTAIEILAKDRLVMLSGEVKFGPRVAERLDIRRIVETAWERVGYPDGSAITVLNHLQQQSPEIGRAVTRGDGERASEGAGDQGIMVGYATNETKTMMPLEYELARSLCREIEALWTGGVVKGLRADAKTQVTIDGKGRPKRIVIAVQHAPGMDQGMLKAELLQHAFGKVFEDNIDPAIVTVNGTKSFEVGGTIGDAGVVGRKIVVDAYGPSIPVGGGAYSGKDPTKVDRSAAYMARHMAKTAVSMGIRGAKSCTVHIAYCIGKTAPEMVTAVTDAGVDITDWVSARFRDLSPRAVIEHLDLLRMRNGLGWRYRDAAAFGHYGRPEFPWEQIGNVSD